jgi:uncharacterized protein YxeA
VFTVADVAFNHLGTSACLFKEWNYKQKNPYYSFSNSPCFRSDRNRQQSAVQQNSRTAFIGHGRGTGSDFNCAKERREKAGVQCWAEI